MRRPDVRRPNLNLYLDTALIESIDGRHVGDHAGWNRSSVVRTMLTLYLELARTPPSLPPGAIGVLRRLFSRPEDYSPQLLRLLPAMVESHPRLEPACRASGVSPGELVTALRALAPHEVLAVLDSTLRHPREEVP